MSRYRLIYRHHSVMSDMPLFSVEKKCRWLGWSLVSGSAFTEKSGREFIETLQRVERENDPFFRAMMDPDRE